MSAAVSYSTCVMKSGQIQPHSKQVRLGLVLFGLVRLGFVRFGLFID